MISVGKWLTGDIDPTSKLNVEQCFANDVGPMTCSHTTNYLTSYQPFANLKTMFVCLVFNGTFSTNRPYRAIAVKTYHVGPGDNTDT